MKALEPILSSFFNFLAFKCKMNELYLVHCCRKLQPNVEKRYFLGKFVGAKENLKENRKSILTLKNVEL